MVFLGVHVPLGFCFALGLPLPQLKQAGVANAALSISLQLDSKQTKSTTNKLQNNA